MNIITQFTSKQNLSLLWDVLLDEININTTNKQLITNIKLVFDSNLMPFTNRINTNAKPNLMELNKQFLRQVVLAVNKLFSKDYGQNNIQRITITNEEVSEPYKIEDIRASRQSDFEKEVIRKKADLENYMTIKKPRELEFSDKMTDDKIIEIESLVAEKLAERNTEIELLQNTNYNTTGIDKDKWLSSVETSVKGEKIKLQINELTNTSNNNSNNNSNNKLKHINIDSNNNVSLLKDKKVSWSNDEPVDNIFLKLKKRPDIVEIGNSSYEEQQSSSLPEVKQEVVNRQPTNKPSLPIVSNNPIIPNSEIVAQINDLNTKINTLFAMVAKLSNIIENHTSMTSTDVQESNV